MNRFRFFSFIAALLVTLAYFGYAFRVAQRQAEEFAALRRRALQLGTESSALRKESALVTHDLAEAERQLAALPPVRTTIPGESPERRTELNSWLTRVKQLQRLLDAHPEQRIPEMQFLTDQDWLRIAKRLDPNSEDGVRKVFAAIRDAAAVHFTKQLSAALKKFRESQLNNAPASIATLATFFDSPPSPEMLVRYELIKVTESYENNPRWRVQTKAPIDEDYDVRHAVDVYVDGRGSGSSSTTGPWAWVPGLRAQSESAYQAYSTANKGASPAGISDVLPYFNPPLSPALAGKLIKAERAEKQ